ncbi:MAG: carbohydrate kinase family protein [Gemmataceae bacterium]|nr:carbohydrate kinase family protein [Gemmataceae bacterium]
MSTSPQVLCAGIIVADHVCTPIERVPGAGELVMADGMLLTIGGCAANAAVDLAKMGVRTAVVGRVGKDAFGRIVTDFLRDAQVDATHIRVSATADTSQTLIVNVQGQDRRFIHTFGANAEFSAADVPLTLLDTCKVLYIGGYLLMPGLQDDELIPLFTAARARGVKTVVDVAIPKPDEYLPRLRKLLPYVDVFLPNNHEGEALTGEKDPLRQAETFQRLGVRTAIITMGGEGSILVQDGLRLRAGVYRVPFVDASGGGDAFDAGYIYGLLHDLGPEDCLRVASALGASCVRAVGTTPGVFTQSECDAFLHEQVLRIERIS